MCIRDRCFGPESTQQEVYKYAAEPIVASITEGYNGTVFAYGQTSSGKTHTMEGPDRSDPDMQGVVPRMISTIFDKIYESTDSIEFQISVSYFEIYMERVKDLLNPTSVNMSIREHPQRGIYVDGAAAISVSSPDDVHNVMSQGANNRSIAVTNMNEHSSRSHSVFMLTVSQTNMDDLSKKSGKLYLVDLAGSEKAAKTGATGQKMDEAKKINASLTSLGIVITKLTEGATHIPYRDSKLTRILTESLGGNAKTCLIICCSPSVYNDAETLGTLQFGMRAKMIKNKPKVNRELSIPELKQLVAKLEKKIASQQKYIKVLERKLEDNSIDLPDEGLEVQIDEEGAAAGESNELAVPLSPEDEEALMSAMSPKSMRQGEMQENEQELAVLRMERTEAEEKINSYEEEKEFMKSLMDDLLEQLAQKEAEKKTISEEVEAEMIELKAQALDSADENNMLINKLAELTSELEKAKSDKVLDQGAQQVANNAADEVTAEMDSWAEREEELKKRAEDAAAEMAQMESSLKEMNKVQEDSAETKAKLAQMEDTISSLEADRTQLRDQLRDAQEGSGMAASEVASSEQLQKSHDELQRVQAELASKSAMLDAKEGDWTKEKEGYLLLHKSLEGQLSDLKDQLSKQGGEYEELKISLMKDLQNRCEKVVELQINLDEARENYHRLLQNSNHRVLSRKVLYLERSLETLKAAYQESVSQKSTLRIDKQVAEKKCEQKDRELKTQEANLKELKEENRSYKMQLGVATSTAYENYMSSLGGDYNRVGIRGGVRGGAGGRKPGIRGGIRGGVASSPATPATPAPANETAAESEATEPVEPEPEGQH
eukprot:TRINITY_DN17312_c0_g1_i3.p1 TRINITY_DN17312_c0_g1~~TRINITY_DN17312_c0_g1_i3.p1  ORF type:complete len:832 (-),score=339.18 TRINITY_DN17312_c0_g1_i3:356-2851(-)